MAMRPRLLPLALVLALSGAGLLPPRLAAADGAAPSKPAPPATAPTAAPAASGLALSPLRAAVEAAAVPRKPVSAPLVIAGGITAGIGAAGALAGLLLMSVDPSSCTGAACGVSRQDAGRITLFVGAPVLAVGLTMVIIGIQPAPDADATARARLVPAVAVGPTGGTLRWRF
jgi:hypothetical protein